MTHVQSGETPHPDVSHAGAGGLTGHGPLMPGQTFGERYHIVRLLGLGGMGAVYQAWDQELGVVVALKVIRPEAAADSEAAQALERRFKQELLLARQVTHKNVVRIHDLGELQGIKYITMPYIEGEDLATILKQEGRLDVGRTMRIARSMLSGLAAAHAAGVVHRDLKPANIMINAEGEALIMDFGIARSVTRPSSAATIAGLKPLRLSGGETMLGSVVGTVHYMAPEQARGEPADHRADIYAFGLILYDLLLGRQRASRTDSALEELNLRIKAPPPAPRTIDPHIPEALERIVMRCVQPDADARYATTAELVTDFDRLDDAAKPLPIVRRLTWRLAAAALTVFVVLLGLTWWLARGPAPPVERAAMSVLVADFQNKTDDPVFNGALEQALTIGIEGASFISAFPRATAQQSARRVRTDATLDEATARLVALSEEIKMVLAGSIESRGSAYTITVNAVDPANGQRLATSSISASSKPDVLSKMAALAGNLRSQLGDTEPESDTLAAKETITAASVEAMQAYAKGLELNDEGRFADALKWFELAVSNDSGLGRAYAGMGTAYYSLRQYPKAADYYGRALKLLDRMSHRERLRTQGLHYLTVSRNYEQAKTTFEELVAKYPADRAGHANLAVAYVNLRDFPKAMSEGRKAIEIYPKNIVQRTNYAMYAMYAGDFKTAMEQANIVLKANPSFEYAFLTLARSAAAAGDLEGARLTYQRLSETSAIGVSMAKLGEIDLAMYQGHYRQALRLLEPLTRGTGQGDESRAALLVAAAEVNQALGQGAAAVRAAGRAAELNLNDESILFPAARVLVDSGRVEQASELARRLENLLQSQTASYARLIDAELALKSGRLLLAMDAIRDAQKRHDSWYAHFLLGRAYFEARHFVEALAEFERCLTRKGETTDVFIVDGSTLRYLPPLYYWLGRAQEGLGNAGARDNYQKYLDLRRTADPPDPLADDARRRLGTAQTK